MCNFEAEDIRLLFFHCIVARNLWDMFLNIFGLSWFMPLSMKDALISWYSWKGQKSRRNMWQAIPSCILSTWMLQESEMFEGTSDSIPSQGARCLSNLCNCYCCVGTKRHTFVILHPLDDFN